MPLIHGKRYRVVIDGQAIEGTAIYLSPVFHDGDGWYIATGDRLMKWDDKIQVAIVEEKPGEF